MTNPINGRKVTFPFAYPGHEFSVIDGEAGIYHLASGKGGMIQLNHDATPWNYADEDDPATDERPAPKTLLQGQIDFIRTIIEERITLMQPQADAGGDPLYCTPPKWLIASLRAHLFILDNLTVTVDDIWGDPILTAIANSLGMDPA